MRRDSIDDIAGGPYRSSRQRAMEERRKQNAIDNARRQSELLRKIEHERAEQRAWKRILFCLWHMLEEKLTELEDLRDENRPHSYSERWNDAFCYAIRKIPEVRMACEDAWLAYINIDRAEFSEYI